MFCASKKKLKTSEHPLYVGGLVLISGNLFTTPVLFPRVFCKLETKCSLLVQNCASAEWPMSDILKPMPSHYEKCSEYKDVLNIKFS